MKKRILYFIPDNPFGGKSGNRTRYIQLLDYLSSISEQYDTEVLSISDWGRWNDTHKAQFATRYPNIRLHLMARKGSPTNKIKKFFEYKLPNAIPRLFKGTTVDITNFILRKKVKKLIDHQKYNIVIGSYASWARIFDNIGSNITKIIDTHDFITAQRKHKKNKIGKLFQSEMKILGKQDIIWTYSTEEAYIFEQFTQSKIVYIPTSGHVPRPRIYNNDNVIDVLYVASSNKHNIKSAEWLYHEVIPYIKDIKIHIIGEICNHIEDHPNIVKHGIVDVLSSFYLRSKIAICPMLSGTGVKIKVIEALSYGLPVVTTRRGIDGLPNKVNNGCIVTTSAEDFSSNISRLIREKEYYEKHCSEAEYYYQQCHHPKLEKDLLNTIFLAK